MTDAQILQKLGLRMERLLLLGIVLLFVVLYTAYLTLAIQQIDQDRSVAPIINLQNKLIANRETLTQLFNTKSLAKPQKKLSQPFRSDSIPLSEWSYEEALDLFVAEILGNSRAAPLNKFIDPKKSPDEIIKLLQEQRAISESKPASVWGVQTQPILKVGYVGFDYSIPIRFFLKILVLGLAPVILVWLESLSITRNHEIIAIEDSNAYKFIFPHILNKFSYIKENYSCFKFLFFSIKFSVISSITRIMTL